MPLNFVATPADFDTSKGLTEILRTHSNWVYRFRFLWFAILALAPIAVAKFYPSYLPIWYIKYGAFFPFLWAILLIWVSSKRARAIKRSVQNAKVFAETSTYTLDEKGISQESASQFHRLNWSVFTAAMSTSQGIAMMLSEAQFMWLPNSAFASENMKQETLNTIQDWIEAAKT